jgi:peptidoglycan/LPS O-acetylase OafA/YrhL
LNPDHTASYRLDIQGLRAIAITLVVLGHASVPGFSGGFVGVDVFFVLSGFLITGLLVQERLDRGAIHYGTFLARRLRRLLPALLAMLLLVMLLAAVLLSSYEARMQTGSFVYSATWTSNFYFAFAEFDYFAALKAKDFFLHTWSLGIEEQFYIVWPWLVMLSFAIAAGRSRADPNLTSLVVLIAIVFSSSLGLCLYWTQTNQLLSFYMMPARGWQFALGASVYVYARRNRAADSRGLRNARSSTVRQLTGLSGLILILGSAAMLHRELTYPGFLALFPSVGAALTLFAGAGRGQSISSRVLSSKAFVWLGDRSYSLYLWHWPVLLFGSVYGLTDHMFGTVLLVAGSIFIATLSYHLIELPFWKGRFSVASPRRIVELSVLAMLVMVGTSQMFVADTFAPPSGLINQDEDSSRAASSDVFVPGLHCDSWYSNSEITPCIFGDDSARHTAVLIGDSIGAQWASMLPKIYAAPDWRILVLTKSSCAITDVEYYYGPAGGLYDVCTDWRNASLDYVAELNPEVVFVGSSAAYDFSESQWIGGTERVLTKLAKAAGHVVVIPGTPGLSFHGPSCLKEPYRFTARLRDSENLCEEALTSTVNEEVAEYLARAVIDIPNADVLNVNDLVCPGKRCAARTKEGVAVFRDQIHLTASFVLEQAPEILSRLNSIRVSPKILERVAEPTANQ